MGEDRGAKPAAPEDSRSVLLAILGYLEERAEGETSLKERARIRGLIKRGLVLLAGLPK